MVLFLTAILVLSSLAMAALLWIKDWELRTGHMLLPDMRPRAAEILHTGATTIEQVLPKLVEQWGQDVAAWLRGSAREGLARGLAAAEMTLERALHALRHKTVPPPSASGQASAFLREVAEYKQKLLKRSQGKGPTNAT